MRFLLRFFGKTHPMERVDMARWSEQAFARFLKRGAQDGALRVLRTTSGTTGGGPMMFVREYRGGKTEWFSSAERTLACFGSLQVRLTYALYLRYDASIASGSALFLDAEDMRDLPRLAEEFAPGACVGWPHTLVRTARAMPRRVRLGISRLCLTGELLTDAVHAAILRDFPNATVRSQYITAETGFISSLSCAHAGPRRYHPARGVEVEIDGPDASGAGDLLVSTRTPYGQVRRYRVGDIARIEKGVCACGERVIFDLLGRRGYDFIKAAGLVFVRGEFDRLAARCAELFDDYRAEISEVERDGAVAAALELRVFRQGGTPDTSRIIREYEEHLFLGPYQRLSDAVRDGRCAFLVRESTEPFPSSLKQMKMSFRSA